MKKNDILTIISKLIQKQMIILGPGIALNVAKKVESITVNDKGEVIEIEGDESDAMDKIINEYVKLTGEVSRLIVKNLTK